MGNSNPQGAGVKVAILIDGVMEWLPADWTVEIFTDTAGNERKIDPPSRADRADDAGGGGHPLRHACHGEQTGEPEGDRGMTWQPIDTAPKDGTLVLLYWPTMSITRYPAVGFHDGDVYGWEITNDRGYGEVFPTHWMPLPEPPQS